MAQNEKAATEDEVGVLHKNITIAYTMKVSSMMRSFILAEDNEDEVAMAMAIDTRDLAAAGKWVLGNEVTCSLPQTQEKNELKDMLAQTKAKHQNKVISFSDKAG